MRVAYFLSMFPCWSETFILRELTEIHRRGVDVTIYSLKPCNETLVHSDAAAFVSNGQVVYPSPVAAVGHFLANSLLHPLKTFLLFRDFKRSYKGSIMSLVKSYATFVLAADLLAKLRSKGIEHIHAPWGTYPSTAALYCSRLAGYPFSFTTRAHDLFLEDHALHLKFSEARFSQTITDYNRRVIGSRYPGLALDTLHVIHSSLYPENYDAPRTPELPPRIMSVGRLVEMKGFGDLISACALLRGGGIEFRCEIVGDGPLKDELHRQIDDLGLRDCVQILDPVPQEEIRRMLCRATCFVLPCITARDGDQDGIPNVLMEALAARVPAVSCPTSGVPELIEDGKTGLLVTQRDPKGLADGVVRILNDKHLQDFFSENGRKKVEDEFNVRKNAARLMALFVGQMAVKSEPGSREMTR